MEIMTKTNKEKLSKAITCVSIFMDTPYFAIALGILTLVSYFLGLDLLIIAMISICISFAFLFNEKLNCLFVVFLFMSAMISYKNSPVGNYFSNGSSNFFFNVYVVIFCIISICIPVLFCVLRLIKNFKNKTIDFNFSFVSIAILGFSFLVNGLLMPEYNPLNFLFGLFLFFFFFVFFYSILPNISIKKEDIVGIAKQTSFFAITVILEIIAFYIATFFVGEDIFLRLSNLLLGWGNKNTVGMLLIVSFCLLFFLFIFETSKRWKIFSFVLMLFLLIGILLSFSKQTYLAFALIILFYLIYKLIKTNSNCKKNLLIILSFYSLFFILLIAFLLYLIFSNTLNIESLSNGRIELWGNAILSFKNNCLFGSGFYFIGSDPNINLGFIMPYCFHNTLLQMLGSCGLFGFLSYCLYRIVSIKEIIKHFDENKVCFIFGISAMLIMSLVDIHIFDLFGSGIYIFLLAFCVAKKEDQVVFAKCEAKNEKEENV